jgi:protein-S-isoprenylcysteine O-methyltransferase Ste14
MRRELLRSIVLLPGTALLFVPGILLSIERWLGKDMGNVGPQEIQFWAALLLLILGLALAIWTVRLQLTIGQGTPAPWDPPVKLVVQGPYRHVRNPMITGAFLIIAAESLFFHSCFTFLWLLIFIGSNLVYIPRVEEGELIERFGEEYLRYLDHVPRWIPRVRPWRMDVG